VATSAASRKGLTPAQRPAAAPVDPRLRPWYDRCKGDHDRLATLSGQHSTTYALRAYTARLDGLRDLVNRQGQLIAALADELADVRSRLSQIPWQPTLPAPDQGKLPESVPGVRSSKAGSKPAAAR
jgi:hypothetical protein